MNFNELEMTLERKIAEITSTDDPSHDLLHFKRVVRSAKSLCASENGKLEVVLPAAWLHDFVIIPKNDPRRKTASQLSAQSAVSFLREIHYPQEFLDEIAHAIEAHSFSANIPTRTLEAKIVQDADRLDALGAIGVARCFATSSVFKSQFYEEKDPFCKEREPNDRKFTVDHFYAKLFKVAEQLKTEAGRIEGRRRMAVMSDFLSSLALEI